jgi:hypothetical protein
MRQQRAHCGLSESDRNGGPAYLAHFSMSVQYQSEETDKLFRLCRERAFLK